MLGIISILVLITVTFILVRLMPGSPFQAGSVSPQMTDALNEEYGLDRSWLYQYMSYMQNLLHGDLGISYQKPGVYVTDVISRAWPVTLSIAAPALLISIFFGVFIGSVQAKTRKKSVKYIILAKSFLGMAIPNFVIASILMLIFGQVLKWFPVAGLMTPAHYILPVISLAIYPTSFIAKLTNNAFLEELHKDYVMMARAKRLTDFYIAANHILINVWPSVINYMGTAAAVLLTGSFVVESIFTIPGIGREFVFSIMNRDYTMILGLTIFMGITVIVVMLIADLLCVFVNPRIRRHIVLGKTGMSEKRYG